MRKWRLPTLLIAIVLALALAAPALAQPEYKPPDQSTMAWDPVTTLANGDPLPAGNEIRYEVFLEAYPLADPQDPNLTPITTDPITATEFTYTFLVEGMYIGGVRAVRYVDDPNNPGTLMVAEKSIIAWSDNPVDVQTAPWVWYFYWKPATPINLR